MQRRSIPSRDTRTGSSASCRIQEKSLAAPTNLRGNTLLPEAWPHGCYGAGRWNKKNDGLSRPQVLTLHDDTSSIPAPASHPPSAKNAEQCLPGRKITKHFWLCAEFKSRHSDAKAQEFISLDSHSGTILSITGFGIACQPISSITDAPTPSHDTNSAQISEIHRRHRRIPLSSCNTAMRPPSQRNRQPVHPHRPACRALYQNRYVVFQLVFMFW